MLQTNQQSKSIRITAQRPFRLVERDSDGHITGHKVVKPGDVISVERTFGLEMVAVGKAVEGEVKVRKAE